MKLHNTIKAWLLAVLMLSCILSGSAFAEETEVLEMELFTAGDFPEYIPIQTFAANSLDAYIYEQLMKGTAVIDISEYQIPKEDIRLTLTMIVNDHPDLFFVGSSFSIGSLNGYVRTFKPQYLFTGDDLKARQAAFNATVDEIVNHANEASTTIGKLLRVNDYFCTNYAYDESLSIFRPDQLFTGGTGVCQAYMLGYAAVLDELGIPNTHATSLAMQHTWNLVNVEDSWYHIDVTWNDPVADTKLQAVHNYFMLSDTGMRNSKHHSWTETVVADNSRYDSCFWRSINTPLAPIGNHVYYLSTTADNGIRSLMDWNAATAASSKVLDFSIIGPDNSYTYYPSFGPVAADSESIYYGSRNMLWAVDHNGQNAVPVYSTGDDDTHIQSCYLENGTLFMRIKAANGSTSVVSCPASQRPEITFAPKVAELTSGETMVLEAASNIPLEFTLLSTNTDVVTIDANNRLTAHSPGAAYIVARHNFGPDILCPVIVHAADQLVLPQDTVELASESFLGTSVVEIILPDGLQVIGPNAFAACEDLVLLHLPDSVKSIDPTAIPKNNMLTLVCRENSASAAFAQEQGYPCILLPESFNR